MPRSIFVALWARETEKKTLNHNIGTRMYCVERAMQAAWAKYKATKGDYAGLIHAIFLAPEYLFTNPREEDQATSLTRAVTEANKSYLVKTLTERSKNFPEMLIAPGTIIYALDEKKYPISFAKSRAKDAEQMEKLEKSMPVRPKEALKNLAPVGRDVPVLGAKITKLKSDESIGFMIKNKMFVFLNGKVEAKYGKRADMFEATGDVPGVFIPGKYSGIKEIDKLFFGFEICYDHEVGVLKALSAKGSEVDFHLIASAEVTNNTANMYAKAGGFVLHASSNAGYTTVFYKPGPAWKLNHKQFRGAWADEKEAEGAIEAIGTEPIDGDPLKYYLLTRE